jgi:hypothetical protein
VLIRYRERDDTVKNIVGKLFDDMNSDEEGELASELKRTELIVLEGDDYQEDYLDPNWTPMPSDIGKSKPSLVILL